MVKLVKATNEQLTAKGYLPTKTVESKQVKLGFAAEKDINEICKQFIPFKCKTEVYVKFLDFIGLDGVLLFRLMRVNASAPVVHEIMSQLFFEYVDKRFK